MAPDLAGPQRHVGSSCADVWATARLGVQTAQASAFLTIILGKLPGLGRVALEGCSEARDGPAATSLPSRVTLNHAPAPPLRQKPSGLVFCLFTASSPEREIWVGHFPDPCLSVHSADMGQPVSSPWRPVCVVAAQNQWQEASEEPEAWAGEGMVGGQVGGLGQAHLCSGRLLQPRRPGGEGQSHPFTEASRGQGLPWPHAYLQGARNEI